MSYTRIGSNLGDCLFQLGDKRFFRVETYFSSSESTYAVGKAAKNVQQLDLLENENTYDFFYELFGLEELEIISTDNIISKTVVLVQESTLLVSVMREGFEHN